MSDSEDDGEVTRDRLIALRDSIEKFSFDEGSKEFSVLYTSDDERVDRIKTKGPSAVAKPGACNRCSAKTVRPGEGTTLLRCSSCKITHYCSRSCQREDWVYHKKWCKAFVKSGIDPAKVLWAPLDISNPLPLTSALNPKTKRKRGHASPGDDPASAALVEKSAVNQAGPEGARSEAVSATATADARSTVSVSGGIVTELLRGAAAPAEEKQGAAAGCDHGCAHVPPSDDGGVIESKTQELHKKKSVRFSDDVMDSGGDNDGGSDGNGDDGESGIEMGSFTVVPQGAENMAWMQAFMHYPFEVIVRNREASPLFSARMRQPQAVAALTPQVDDEGDESDENSAYVDEDDADDENAWMDPKTGRLRSEFGMLMKEQSILEEFKHDAQHGHDDVTFKAPPTGVGPVVERAAPATTAAPAVAPPVVSRPRGQ